MSGHHSIRGVFYGRMSTDKQEESLPQQREWAERACKREGVEIVASFEDPAIPGDEIARRPGLQKLLAYCEQNEVDCVVTWNSDRFSRSNSIRTAALVCRLLDAGLTRMLTADGWIDFENETDLLVFNIKQDSSNASFSKKLSENVSRSCLARARDGKWNGGRIPYGYVVGPDQHLALDDPARVEGAQTLFQLIASGITAVRVAAELERLGYPRPKYGSKRWNKNTVYGIVTNIKYTGVMDYGYHHTGKYHEVTAQGHRKRKRAPRTKSGRLRQVAAPEDAVMVENSHPAIVDRELFDKAQRALASNCVFPKRGEKQHRRSHEWPLSGLAYCQECGHRMYGVNAIYHGVRVRRYICGAYVIHGRDGCNPNAIREDVLLPLVFDAVRRALANPKGIANVRRAIEKEVQQGQAVNTEQIRQLRRQAEDLAQKIKPGKQNLLIVPPRMVDELTPILDEWRTERDKLLAEAVRLEEAEAKASDDRARVDRAMEAFHKLGEWLARCRGNCRWSGP
jgi:site-specific DNA recombinase